MFFDWLYIFFFFFFDFWSHVGKPHLFSWSLVTLGRGHPQATLLVNVVITVKLAYNTQHWLYIWLILTTLL